MTLPIALIRYNDIVDMQLVSNRTSACYGCINLGIGINSLIPGQSGYLSYLSVLIYCFNS